jgi:hypothetical protein
MGVCACVLFGAGTARALVFRDGVRVRRCTRLGSRPARVTTRQELDGGGISLRLIAVAAGDWNFGRPGPT